MVTDTIEMIDSMYTAMVTTLPAGSVTPKALQSYPSDTSSNDFRQLDLQLADDFLIDDDAAPEFSYDFTNSVSSPVLSNGSQNHLFHLSDPSQLDFAKEDSSHVMLLDSFGSFLVDLEDSGLSSLEANEWDQSLALPLDDLLASSNTFGSQGTSDLQPTVEKLNAGLDTSIPIFTDEDTISSTPYISLETPDISSPSRGVITNNQCWHAISTRSHAADRLFVYGVLSTKIYCRPSCPSRRPSRSGVKFFPYPNAIEAAENAKFRACKRCKPNTNGIANAGVVGIGLALEKIAGEVTKSGDTPLERRQESKLEELAKAAGLSVFHFHRLFKAVTRMTPGEYTTACHSLALQDVLGKDSEDLSFGMEGQLFGEFSRWSLRTARKALGGISPTEYIEGAKTAKVEYTTIDTAFGRMCVAWSTKSTTKCCRLGQCKAVARVHALLFGQDSERRIRGRFPLAVASTACVPWLRDCVRQLEAEGKDREAELPAEVVPLLRRARVWLRLLQDPVMGEQGEGCSLCSG